MTRKTFTVFCQDRYDPGTTWIDSVQASGVEDAKRKAVKKCADDWGYAGEVDLVDSIACIGVAKGNVQILDWEDIA